MGGAGGTADANGMGGADGTADANGMGGAGGTADANGMGGAGGTTGDGTAGENCDPSGTGGWDGKDEACDGSVGEYPGESDAERKARLEGDLEKSVGGFDEVLADEQREISTVGRNTDGFGSGQGGAGTRRVGLGKQGGSGGSGGSGGAAGSIAGPQEAQQASVSGLSEEEIKARTPDDIPDLVSEDIVARQLREAALAEEDPVLRERL